MINPTPKYSPENEAQFRRDAEAKDLQNIKPDKAVASFLMMNDDGSPYRVTLVAGVLTATAVPL